jgi:Domain of unknown function (DUF305)
MEELMTDSTRLLQEQKRVDRRWLAIRWCGPPGHLRIIAGAIALAIAAGSAASAHDASNASTSASIPSSSPESNEEATYLAENDAAMKKMMTDMSIKPSGDVDADFVAMMVPHHQGAVDMARAELRYGHNEQLRRIAREIIVEQAQEITAMRLALGHSLSPSVAAPTQPSSIEGTDKKLMDSTNTLHDSMIPNQEH